MPAPPSQADVKRLKAKMGWERIPWVTITDSFDKEFGGGGAMEAPCAAAHGGAPLGGMAPMYALMSALHLGPWLKLVA